MSARVHLASEFTMARNGFAPARLMLAGGLNFMADVRDGYPFWGYTDNSIIAHERLARASLLWLTGKATGMSLLLFANDPGRTGAWGVTWFEDFVTRGVVIGGLEGTLDYSGVGLDGSGWGAYDPHDYDAVLIPAMAVDAYPFVDAYLAANGAIWGLTITPAENWERYGFNNGTGFQANDPPAGPPDWMNAPFACAPLGTGTYRYAVFSSCPVAADTNTIGGTSTLYADAYGLWTSD